MKTKTASGPDNISSHMLRNTARSISPFLHKLFNLSLSTGRLPSEWKVSNITPIPKGGDASQCPNYRPISLLSLVSKILERIIHNQLLSFLLKYSFISRFQFGFRPNSSTQEALLHLTNEWHQQLDSGNHPSFLTYQRLLIQFHIISSWRACSVSESVVPSLPGLKITYLAGFNVWSWIVTPQLLSKSHQEFLRGLFSGHSSSSFS